jgi:FkbM family methyltransferase
MKQVGGVWLPDGETHMIDVMLGPKKRIVGGFATYQYNKLTAAIKAVPERRRRRCIDIGAHCGTWSMHLVKLFRHVDAFEPVAAHCDCYVRNVGGAAGGSNYSLWPVALGDTPGRVGIVEVHVSSGSAHVRGAGDIEMRTLDSFGFDEVDFIKIDVEGLELAVCRGGADTIRRNRPIMIVEQKGREVTNYGEKTRDLAVSWLERTLGMKRLGVISGDWIMGWPG